MAYTPSKFLSTDANIFLRDQRHASRLFVDDQFRLAPKFDHLFSVVFNINQAALQSINLTQRHQSEINMLVKSVALPKFTITAETVNQYNRKKVVQSQHKIEDTLITFHDDNMGLINMLWQNYYSYYYADSISAKTPGAYNRTATRNSNFIKTAYGLDNGSTNPFFNYITIYHMARHEYVAYKLHNPIIKSFDHKDVKYNGPGNLHENTMLLSYEAVSYDTGEIGPFSDNQSDNITDPSHYDTTPSPLFSNGAPTNTSPSFSSQQGVQNNVIEALNNTVSSINSYQNTTQKTTPGIPGLLQTDNTQGLGGIAGISFPTSPNAGNTGTTVAKKINLTP
jgi:hypothetical protein